MRTLSDTLLQAQQGKSMKPAIKVTLAFPTKTTYIFTESDRLLSIAHEQQPWSENATIVLDNSDGYLTAINLRGYKATISYGLVTPAGAEYSDAAPLFVISQKFNSSPGNLTCELACIGMMEQLAEDRASVGYIPTSETVKALITSIMGSTLAPYNTLPAYTVVYETSSDADTLLTGFVPAQSFRILVNTTRLAAVRRLLGFTKCVGRFEGDGAFHIFVPTTSGVVYDYEYEL